jgi:hypothetical protein
VCSDVTELGFGTKAGLPVPTSGTSGGWAYVGGPATIRLEQHGCERITVSAPFGTYYPGKYYDRVMASLPEEGVRYRVVRPDPSGRPGYFRVDQWSSVGIDLVAGPRREVWWSATSVSLRYPFRAEGVGAGWSSNYVTLALRKLPGGALLYNVRQDQVPGADQGISCVLPAAPEGSPEEAEPPGSSGRPSAG